MGRIRSIKPEFPHSESMGRVSRDARLLFIMLFTVADDEGRARAASRMLASLLFPYDDDAPLRIPEWLMELERQNCIQVYSIDGNTYLQIINWTDHQKIDRPTKSKLPGPSERKKRRESAPKSRETSRASDEVSSLDQGREGKGEDQGRDQGRDQGQEGIIARSADADEPQLALQAYNSVAKELGWPEAVKITNARLSKLRTRLTECGGVAGWHGAMAKARASPWLRGETRRGKGFENWTPDLDFFLQQASFTKLLEGKYDERSNPNQTAGLSGIIAAARVVADQ